MKARDVVVCVGRFFVLCARGTRCHACSARVVLLLLLLLLCASREGSPHAKRAARTVGGSKVGVMGREEREREREREREESKKGERGGSGARMRAPALQCCCAGAPPTRQRLSKGGQIRCRGKREANKRGWKRESERHTTGLAGSQDAWGWGWLFNNGEERKKQLYTKQTQKRSKGHWREEE